MEKKSDQLKVGDYIIQNNYHPETINDYKFLKIFEVIEMTPQPIIVIGRHLDLISHLVANRFRLASEKEIKEYKLKSIFHKEVKK
jgi:hypothetical protein